MARVTVEDCVKQVPNRFELVLIAAKRARRLTTGAAQPCLDWENDKSTVLALREIAAGFTFTDDEDETGDTGSNAGTTTTSGPRNILGSHAPFSE